MYKIIITPDSEGGFNANVPALKGCMTHGETPQEALEVILDVQRLWLEIAEERGWEVPKLVLDK
jgi:predicted RNase H-like HicB family nuclease